MRLLLTITMAVIISLCIGCKTKTSHADYYTPDSRNYSVLKIDECEYILWMDWKALVHKGDCSNPIHKVVVPQK